jgi:hypothetical protein
MLAYSKHASMFMGAMIGLVIADVLVGKLWSFFFNSSIRFSTWEPIKLWIFLMIALGTAGFTGGILGVIGL